ncbi:hypothetical protein CDAR_85811 [Caerostris darwini]|uniref:Uncharacterized protein n=1 Tax=Caerostris darwini TaxID=1538125 RepID=A0AAV4MZ83_9ARAC|nr:hypothetical protein CDAR_85811 [Caerostris darwini]
MLFAEDSSLFIRFVLIRRSLESSLHTNTPNSRSHMLRRLTCITLSLRVRSADDVPRNIISGHVLVMFIVIIVIGRRDHVGVTHLAVALTHRLSLTLKEIKVLFENT